MGSLSPSFLPDGPDAQPPELSSLDYAREVLDQPEGKTEHDVDAALAARAAELHIDPDALESPESPEPPEPSKSPESPEAPHSAAPRRARTDSATSNGSGSTGLTSRGSLFFSSGFADAAPRLMSRRSNSLSFSQYEKYLDQIGPNLTQPKFFPACPKPNRPVSVFGGNTKLSVKELRQGLVSKLKWKKKPPTTSARQPGMYCICCREDFGTHHNTLYTLPCGHTYCRGCVAVMATQSSADETKMPPRCCTQPIPAPIVKAVLPREDQQAFLKAVRQYSTPWEARIFCPDPACGEFIAPRSKPDPKHPFQVVCRACKTRVCVMCKRTGHRLGQDCPEDYELDAVLKIGEKSGWRRCYKCRALVELNDGCTHMTCRCKAQFCYICGGIWDPVVGCPNFCNGDEELERRRAEDEARQAEAEAATRAREEAAAWEEVQRSRAEERSRDSADFCRLREAQAAERERFDKFAHKTRWLMFSRHAERRLALVDRYADQADKMRERHAKTEAHLEDRQIETEMELRAALEQRERSVRIQLKYMEAYCNGLGRSRDGEMPDREVTQKNLEQLGEQYRIRDGIEHHHQAKINVLREKQVKHMEELQERQERESERLAERRSAELESLALECANDEEAMQREFAARRARLQQRWRTAVEILRRDLEERDGMRYGTIPIPEWPEKEASLPCVEEE